MDDVGMLPLLQQHINGLNLYAYANNNPVNMVDPDGRWAWFQNNIVNPVRNWVSGAASSVGSFFSDNWEFIVGGLAIYGATLLSVVTFGAAAALSGLIIGAAAGLLIGGVAGGISSVASGGNFWRGALTGAVIGAFGGINPFAGALVAGGMSLINDRWSGKRGNISRAFITGVIAGTFALFGHAFANRVIAGNVSSTITREVLRTGTIGVTERIVVIGLGGSTIFGLHNLVTDLIINWFAGW